MTALFASTAASASGTDLARDRQSGRGLRGRWLLAAANGRAPAPSQDARARNRRQRPDTAKCRLAQVLDSSTKCLRIAAYDAASTGPANPGTARPPGPSAKITQGARPLQ